MTKKQVITIIIFLVFIIILGWYAGIFNSPTDASTTTTKVVSEVETALQKKCAEILHVDPNEVYINSRFEDYHEYVDIECNGKTYSLYDATNDNAGTATLYYGLKKDTVREAMEIIENYCFKVSGNEIVISYDNSLMEAEEAEITKVYSEVLENLKDFLTRVFQEEHPTETIKQSLLKINEERVMTWTVLVQRDTFQYPPYTWSYPVYSNDEKEFDELIDAIISEDSSYEFPSGSMVGTFEGTYFMLDFTS